MTSPILTATLARIPSLFATTRASREFAALPRTEAAAFLVLIERIVAADPRVEFKKLRPELATRFRCESLWEAKAGRKLRLLIDNPRCPLTIVGFTHRGDSAVFRRER